MRLLGWLMRWLMRAADEGGQCDATAGAAVVAADEGGYGDGWCGCYDSLCVLVRGHSMAGVFDSMAAEFDLIAEGFDSGGIRFHGCSVQFCGSCVR